ncbi:hypothetical protein [Bifidobacterium platyrrhinorum]|uniref:Uncharacterized protein n=1 Tax=Bifidobacterium platyrrhinorum TaxID=2661628 RepID=A0A6L9STL8_9BIFI|nr:hypothetical protein [Bifidobacterium platyrrhinorum]NEG55439.1 hypothetical protein [Bifidobacterium platyrrhinorum]
MSNTAKGAIYVAPHAQLPDCENAFFANTLPIGHFIDTEEIERELHESYPSPRRLFSTIANTQCARLSRGLNAPKREEPSAHETITGTCSVKADAETLKRLFQLTAEPPVYDVQFRRNGILYKRVKCHVESAEDGLSFKPTTGDITGGTIIIEETTTK